MLRVVAATYDDLGPHCHLFANGSASVRTRRVAAVVRGGVRVVASRTDLRLQL